MRARRASLALAALFAASGVRASDSVSLSHFPLRPEDHPFSVVKPFPSRDVPIGSLRLDSELRFEEMFHRLQSPWTASETVSPISGDRTLGKTFRKTTAGDRPWTSGFGNQWTLAMQARPSEAVQGRATLAYQTDYADRFWVPITDEHRSPSRSPCAASRGSGTPTGPPGETSSASTPPSTTRASRGPSPRPSSSATTPAGRSPGAGRCTSPRRSASSPSWAARST
jgi:hypothetical protein